MSEPDLAVNDEPVLDGDEALEAKLKEAIAVDVEDAGTLRKKLTIRVPRATIEEQLSEQYDELRQEAQVPGFRRGRAPIRLIEKRFGSEVGQQVSTNLISKSYLAAIDRESLDALGDPVVAVTMPEERTDEHGVKKKVEVEKLVPAEEALEHLRLPAEGDFTFVCEVEIKPTFELPSLEKIPVKRPKIDITDEMVDKEIDRLQALRGTYKPVSGGKVKADDLLVGTVRLVHEGVTIKEESNAELAARDQRYDGVHLEGFGKQATGCKVGDTVAVDVTIPEDHSETSVRGKPARFEIAILDIKRLETPKIDDTFLESWGFENVQELRDWIKDRMKDRLDRELRQLMFGQIEQYLMDKTDLEVPQGVGQRQTERIVAREMLDLYSKGQHDAEIAKQVDELRLKAAEKARAMLKFLFIMERIAEERDVKATEEEINAAIAEIAEQRRMRFDRVRDEIISTDHLSTLYVRIRDQKIMHLLLETAEISDAEAAAEKPKAKSDKASKSAGGKKTGKKKATKKKQADDA